MKTLILFSEPSGNPIGYAELADLLPESAELPNRPRWLIAEPRTIGIQLRRDF
jgi:hypothetical protein